MKKRYLKVLFWCLAVIWMTVIFCFSAHDAEESHKVSGDAVEFIAKTLVPEYEDFSKEEKEEIHESLGVYVRKMAHFCEYAVLGIIYLLLLGQYNVRYKKLFAFILSVLYACTDEIHQHFVPGRAMKAFDVFVDASGALCGIIVITLLFMFIRKRKNLLERK